jgi:predicted ATPase
MLRHLVLGNLKCFGVPQQVPLAGLTLVFGQNNSGKSTILQSLLLLSQSLESPGFSAALNLSGPLYPAGTYGDVIHGHDLDLDLELQLGIESAGNAPSTIDLGFCCDDPRPPRMCLFRVAGRGHCIAVTRGRGYGGPYVLQVDADRLGGEDDANFSFRAGSFLPILGDELRRRGRPNKGRVEARSWGNEVIESLASLLGGMRALGPFRRAPERRYESSGGAREAIDVLGRDFVDALVRERVEATRKRKKVTTLLDGVNRWLVPLARVRVELDTVYGSQHVWELRLRDDRGRWTNLADAGFGIGQALPVLVEGLRTPAGGVFLVQEPEIHLHPDAQLVMADFLVFLARSGRQVIAETHSEHILLRVRHRLLDSRELPLAPEDLSLLHVAWDKRLGSSQVTALPVDALGQVANWPRGFLDEANEERLALLEAMAKQAEVNGS